MVWLELLLLVVSVSSSEVELALSEDDGSNCTLNLLQAQASAITIEVDQSQNAHLHLQDQISIFWVYGNPGYNCDQVCATRMSAGARLMCDSRGFSFAGSQTGIMQAVQHAGSRCTSIAYASGNGYPAMSRSGQCVFQPSGSPDCRAVAPQGYGRVCSCAASTSRPAASPAVSPSTASAAGGCITKSDVSCTIHLCQKEMGPTKCELKDGSWIHKRCTCEEGYCLSAGNRCVRATPR